MNNRFDRLLQDNNSGLGCWTSLFLLILLLTSVGLGWVINGFLILLGLLFIVPVVAFWGFQWWLQRKLVQDNCPVCDYEFTGFKNTEFRCPSCGEPLQVKENQFSRLTPPGTIDVEAVEVKVQQLDDN